MQTIFLFSDDDLFDAEMESDDDHNDSKENHEQEPQEIAKKTVIFLHHILMIKCL